jgi:two-component system OmpR family response regulator
MRRPRILLVEDDQSLAVAMRVGLQRSGYDVTVLCDGSNFEAVVDQFHPDLTLLDVSLPVGPDGIALARAFRARSDAPVLFVTASDSLEKRLAGFDAGADDYVVKPFALAELLARVAAVLRRTGRLISPVIAIRDFVIDENRRTVTRAGVELALTPTEFGMLSTLARSPGQVFSKGQLLSLLWGFDHYDPNIVEVHMSALRRKLGTPLIHTERGRGYVLRP